MVVLTWNVLCVCFVRRENRYGGKNILKKSNAGSFYDVIDDENDT